MPETFPVADKNTGELVDTEHYSIAEVAERLHLSESTARKLAVADNWPHFKVANRVWLSGSDVAAVVSGMRHNDGAQGVPEATTPPALGEPVPADAWDEAEGPADQDPGGVR